MDISLKNKFYSSTFTEPIIFLCENKCCAYGYFNVINTTTTNREFANADKIINVTEKIRSI